MVNAPQNPVPSSAANPGPNSGVSATTPPSTKDPATLITQVPHGNAEGVRAFTAVSTR